MSTTAASHLTGGGGGTGAVAAATVGGVVVDYYDTAMRFLQDTSNETAVATTNATDSTNTTSTWKGNLLSEDQLGLYKVIYTCLVLCLMFVALISDRVGADMVMLGALILYLVGQIITVNEALIGFSNNGLLTVLALFVVAEGISKTGALVSSKKLLLLLLFSREFSLSLSLSLSGRVE